MDYSRKNVFLKYQPKLPEAIKSNPAASFERHLKAKHTLNALISLQNNIKGIISRADKHWSAHRQLKKALDIALTRIMGINRNKINSTPQQQEQSILTLLKEYDILIGEAKKLHHSILAFKKSNLTNYSPQQMKVVFKAAFVGQSSAKSADSLPNAQTFKENINQLLNIYDNDISELNNFLICMLIKPSAIASKPAVLNNGMNDASRLELKTVQCENHLNENQMQQLHFNMVMYLRTVDELVTENRTMFLQHESDSQTIHNILDSIFVMRSDTKLIKQTIEENNNALKSYAVSSDLNPQGVAISGTAERMYQKLLIFKNNLKIAAVHHTQTQLPNFRTVYSQYRGEIDQFEKHCVDFEKQETVHETLCTAWNQFQQQFRAHITGDRPEKEWLLRQNFNSPKSSMSRLYHQMLALSISGSSLLNDLHQQTVKKMERQLIRFEFYYQNRTDINIQPYHQCAAFFNDLLAEFYYRPAKVIQYIKKNKERAKKLYFGLKNAVQLHRNSQNELMNTGGNQNQIITKEEEKRKIYLNGFQTIKPILENYYNPQQLVSEGITRKSVSDNYSLISNIGTARLPLSAELLVAYRNVDVALLNSSKDFIKLRNQINFEKPIKVENAQRLLSEFYERFGENISKVSLISNDLLQRHCSDLLDQNDYRQYSVQETSSIRKQNSVHSTINLPTERQATFDIIWAKEISEVFNNMGSPAMIPSVACELMLKCMELSISPNKSNKDNVRLYVLRRLRNLAFQLYVLHQQAFNVKEKKLPSVYPTINVDEKQKTVIAIYNVLNLSRSILNQTEILKIENVPSWMIPFKILGSYDQCQLYLDMLGIYLIPYLKQLSDEIISPFGASMQKNSKIKSETFSLINSVARSEKSEGANYVNSMYFPSLFDDLVKRSADAIRQLEGLPASEKGALAINNLIFTADDFIKEVLKAIPEAKARINMQELKMRRGHRNGEYD